MKSIKDFYRAKYKDSLFVIKAGGRVIADEAARSSLLSNIKDLTASGIKILLIYGGGKLIDKELEKQGITPFKIDGRRITTADQIDPIKKVMAADLSYRIGTSMAELELHGLCLSALPPAWVKIIPRPDHEGTKRFDGTIGAIYGEQINALFKSVPFVACPCVSVTAENGVNINADDVAVAIASGTQSRKLIFLTDVDGVLMKDGSTASYLTDKDMKALIADGTVHGGMKVKLENCMTALESGVKRIHLLNGFVKDALAQEIFDTIPESTMLIREQDRQSYLNEIAVEEALKA